MRNLLLFLVIASAAKSKHLLKLHLSTVNSVQFAGLLPVSAVPPETYIYSSVSPQRMQLVNVGLLFIVNFPPPLESVSYIF